MSSLVSIYDSIQLPLPAVNSISVQYRTISTTSNSTKHVEPMRVLIPNNGQDLIERASDALRNLSTASECRKTQLPKVEKSHFLKTEGDVLRVAALQLVHPVNVVLEDILPGAALRCLSEVVARGSKARPDLKWILSVDGKPIVVAILEYKKTRVIRRADFERAFTTPTAKSQAIECAMGLNEKTLLRDNAIALSKQVNEYSDDCKDIAVFDWHSMCVFDLDGNGNTDVAGFTYSCEPNRFRSFLLGMILKGLARNGHAPP